MTPHRTTRVLSFRLDSVRPRYSGLTARFRPPGSATPRPGSGHR